MKKMLIPILTLAATFTALADLTRKDSSEFAYCYEMDENPCMKDLDNSGKNDFTGWNANYFRLDEGTLVIDAPNDNGKYLVSSQKTGIDGDGWQTLGPTSATGFTIEARLKIVSCTGDNGAICIEGWVSGSGQGSRLNFYADKIKLNKTTVMMLDTTSYHTYRITREGGSLAHSIYVDDVLVAENIQDTVAASVYRTLIGSPGKGWQGVAQIDYLRFDKGAFAPKTLVANYDMTDADKRISTSANATDWTISKANGAEISKANGILSVDNSGTYWTTTDSTWKNEVESDSRFVVEFSTKIKSCTLNNGNDRSLQFWAGIPEAAGLLFVGTNHVYWQSTGSMGDNKCLCTLDNTDKMHKFKIAYDGTDRQAGFTVWRDDVKIGRRLSSNSALTRNDKTYSFVTFGKRGANNAGAYDIDNISWQINGEYPSDIYEGTLIILR